MGKEKIMQEESVVKEVLKLIPEKYLYLKIREKSFKKDRIGNIVNKVF